MEEAPLSHLEHDLAIGVRKFRGVQKGAAHSKACGEGVLRSLAPLSFIPYALFQNGLLLSQVCT